VRLIAASNRDLAQMVEDRTFRKDLYCRLNVFPIEMPPLRQRREDIPALARHFMQLHARANNRSITAIEPDGLAASRRPFTRLEIRASTNATTGSRRLHQNLRGRQWRYSTRWRYLLFSEDRPTRNR
jgi:sigma54-dependent transcription regulator